MSEIVSLDFQSLPAAARYRILIGAIVPRPIAFVSTISSEGIGNLAPFSFFNGVSNDPPCLVLSVTRKNDGSKKDTLRNIEETKGFVVNTVSEWMAEPMNRASAEYPYGVDEMIRVGLTPVPSVQVKAARVGEAAIQMECELHQIVEIGNGGVGSSSLIIGRIVIVHVSDAVYRDGRIDIHQLKPIARLAGTSYSRLGEVFDLARPSAAD